MSKPIEAHIRPNISRLETYREEITQMRRLQWPNGKIAQWLRDEHGLTISGEAVRKFCKVRGIRKGRVPRQPARAHRPVTREQAERQAEKEERVFEYDDSGPIDIHGR